MRKSRGFTLVELMITIGVMVVLMGIVFRLAGISGDGRRKATTVSRLHRLENCLSGYYAAFGSYPPVKLHASRDIFKKVSDFGEQNSNGTSQGNISNWGS
ncbi:MAG: type II secretion system protein, partial [Kiritimatiellae bacterium]|nr:type II secretion system protein [Kiritimatiellia bacterium]